MPDLPIVPDGPEHRPNVRKFENCRRWNAAMEGLAHCTQDKEVWFLGLIEALNKEYKELCK